MLDWRGGGSLIFLRSCRRTAEEARVMKMADGGYRPSVNARRRAD